jgi:hypothetical protein
MPISIIPISYNDYFSDYNSDSDEPIVSYNDTVRPSELIRSSKHCNSSDTDSSDDNMILASIEEQREREKKTPSSIRRSLTSFSNRIRILPEPVRSTYTNTNIENSQETTCHKIKPVIGLTATVLIAVGCILAV